MFNVTAPWIALNIHCTLSPLPTTEHTLFSHYYPLQCRRKICTEMDCSTGDSYLVVKKLSSEINLEIWRQRLCFNNHHWFCWFHFQLSTIFIDYFVVLQAPAVDVVGVGLQSGKMILHNLKFDEPVMSFQQDWGPVTALAFRTGTMITLWQYTNFKKMESLREANNKVKWSMHGIGGDVFY